MKAWTKRNGLFYILHGAYLYRYLVPTTPVTYRDNTWQVDVDYVGLISLNFDAVNVTI